MSGIRIITSVPDGYAPDGTFDLEGGNTQGNETALSFGRGNKSKDGLVVSLTNPLGSAGQTYELRVTASPMRTGFVEDVTVVDIFRFSQGQSIIWEDTRFKEDGSPRASYFYVAKLATTTGLDAYGYMFRLKVTFWAADMPVHKPEKRAPRPGPPSDPVRGKAPLKDPVIHIVKTGDYLRALAQHYYGDANLWKDIYDENALAIGANPDRLSPGTKLTIP